MKTARKSLRNKKKHSELTKLPKVSKSKKKDHAKFPVDHYSHSSLALFGVNPIMFKVRYINGQILDSTSNISGVIGKAFHNAMEVYYGGSEDVIVTEQNALEMGLRAGMSFLEEYNDGFIKWSETVPNKQKAQEVFAFTYNSYVAEMPYNPDELVSIEEMINEHVSVEWRDKTIELPVKLKGYVDKIVRRDGKLKIIDYKTTRSFSKPDEIDGEKMLQAVIYYFLVYAKYGEEPYSFIFEEVKTSKNKDGGKQVMQYEIVYADNELFFDFFFRYYEDVTKALNGTQVYVPNVRALFDGDISIIAYIHRLDQDEELARQLKELKVDNITDLLKKQIQSASSMRQFMATAQKNFISAKNLNYEAMKPEEKIQTKLMEHGMLVQFDSVVHGHAFDLYRYIPSIGLKMSKIEGYTADLEQVIGISGIRVLAPIPNSTFVGVEVPHGQRTFPALPTNRGYEIAMGADVLGMPYYFNVTDAPHMLVAGATGSGKSVFLNYLITSLKDVPNTELHLIDPKIVELAEHKGHAQSYEHEPEAILTLLESMITIMEERYHTLATMKMKSVADAPSLSRHFIIVDEFGDLITQHHVKKVKRVVGTYTRGQMAGQPKYEIETTDISAEIARCIQVLGQKARAAGIHMILATQRPSIQIIKGDTKSNFPTKAVFRTAKAVDSIVVLDEPGAEKLLGKGDMLFSSAQGIVRLQGYSA